MIISYADYLIRKAALATRDDAPTATDQSGADDTDINVIVKRYGVYGTMPQGASAARYGEDYSQLPDDLAGFIEAARSVKSLQGQLPPELADMTIEDLVTSTPDAILKRLTPALSNTEVPTT